jgi:DNA-binding response OmpR family regulator
MHEFERNILQPENINHFLFYKLEGELYFNSGSGEIVEKMKPLERLTNQQSRVFSIMLRHPNYVLSLNFLAIKIWNIFDTQYIDRDRDLLNPIGMTIRGIRKKLYTTHEQLGDRLETIKGIGYRWNDPEFITEEINPEDYFTRFKKLHN